MRLYAACATLSLLSVLGLGGCVELSSLEGLHPRKKPTVRCLGELDKASVEGLDLSGRGAGRSKVSRDVSGFSVPARSGALFGGFCEREFVPEEMFHTISSTYTSPPNLSANAGAVESCISALNKIPYFSLATTQKNKNKNKRKA